MKKVIVLVILIIVVASCKKEVTLEYSIISGKIENSFQKEFTINNFDYSISEVIQINDDGTFRDTLFFDEGIYYLNLINKTPIYIEPGNDLMINLNSRDLSSIKFSGKGNEVSDYIYKKHILLKEMLPVERKIFELNEEEFDAKLKEITAAQLNLLDNIEGISKSFKKKEGKNLNYFRVSKINEYKINHSFFIKDINYTLPSNLVKEVSEITYDIEDDYLFSTDYRTLVHNNYKILALGACNFALDQLDNSYFNIVQEIKSESIKNGVLFDYVKSALDVSENKEILFDNFMKNSTNEKHKEKITQLYNEFKTLAKGSPSPTFENFENAAGGTKSLNDFKGKVVLINIWASSFSSSIDEMKHLKALKEKHSIEIVNISLDIDLNRPNWEKIVKSNEFVGTHLIADKNWNTDFIKSYKVKMVPHYILLDANGVIINSNAPKPSNAKLDKVLSELSI